MWLGINSTEMPAIVVETHRDSAVDMVLSGDGVRCKEIDDLPNREASIGEPVEDLVGRVRRLWNKQIGRGLGDVRTTS